MDCAFSYGVGDSEHQWSNVFYGTLAGLNFSHTGTEGVRLLTMKIAPAEIDVTNDGNLMGSLMKLGNFSFKFRGTSVPIYSSRGFTPLMQIIQSCVENYLRSVTKVDNIITMLPDITQTTKFKNVYGSMVTCSNGFDSPLVPARPPIGRQPSRNVTLNAYRKILNDLGFNIQSVRELDVPIPDIKEKRVEEHASKTSKERAIFDSPIKAILGTPLEADQRFGKTKIYQSDMDEFVTSFSEFMNSTDQETYAIQRLKFYMEHSSKAVGFMRNRHSKK